MPALRMFGPDIWIADGGQAEVLGFRYPTRMAVVRLATGDLFVWSPVALTEGLALEVAALGAVGHIVAPNTLHDLFLEEWRAAYPQARVHAAPGLKPPHAGFTIDPELTDIPPPDWAGDIDQVIVRGNSITTEVVFFHRQSATVLFTDLIQQFRPGWFSGWRALVARLDLMVEAEPAVPRKFRIAFTDRTAARIGLRRILEWPAEKVLMAHGVPVERDGRAFIARAFRWLRP